MVWLVCRKSAIDCFAAFAGTPRSNPHPTWMLVARQIHILASRLIPRKKRHRFVVQPDTLLRWRRELVRRKLTYPRPFGRHVSP